MQPSLSRMYARGAEALPSKAEEKAELEKRMIELQNELTTMRRSLLGVPVALPALGSLHQCEVTGHARRGAFVAGSFGSGYMHASEIGRRVIMLDRGLDRANSDGIFAITGNHTDHETGGAVLMGAEAMLEALVPVGRIVVAEVTSTEGGQVYLSMRDVDQASGVGREPQRTAPMLGESVRCIVSHVNDEVGQQPWAICRLPDFYDPGDECVVEGFIPRSAQFLEGRWLEVGEILLAKVTRLPDFVGGKGLGETGVSAAKRVQLSVGNMRHSSRELRNGERRRRHFARRGGALDLAAMMHGGIGARIGGRLEHKQFAGSKRAKRAKRGTPLVGTLASAISKARHSANVNVHVEPSRVGMFAASSADTTDYVLFDDGSFEWCNVEPPSTEHYATG